MKRWIAFVLAGLMMFCSLAMTEETVFAEDPETLAEEAEMDGEAEEDPAAYEEEEDPAAYGEEEDPDAEEGSEEPSPFAENEEEEETQKGSTVTSGKTENQEEEPENGNAAASGENEDGAEEQDPAEEATLVEDPDNGKWEYHSASLNIVIEKVSEKVKVGKQKKTREYCIAEIWASPESPLYPVMSEPSKKHPAGYKLVSPKLLQNKAHPVFAMSDDLYGIRLKKYTYKGVVIRNGEIMATKTRNSAKKRPWPNLDTMALMEDGSMKTFVCDAHTAEEYLAMGAKQVFSFGPVLISEGKINPTVLSPTYYPYNEPRVAIGMVEPWHYIAVVVRGRPKGNYAGVHLDWLAQLMLDRGCVEALNLDGGLTATMMFNGKIIETGGQGLRSQGSMICFGATE